MGIIDRRGPRHAACRAAPPAAEIAAPRWVQERCPACVRGVRAAEPAWLRWLSSAVTPHHHRRRRARGFKRDNPSKRLRAVVCSNTQAARQPIALPGGRGQDISAVRARGACRADGESGWHDECSSFGQRQITGELG
jgi:hypothetical protein